MATARLGFHCHRRPRHADEIPVPAGQRSSDLRRAISYRNGWHTGGFPPDCWQFSWHRQGLGWVPAGKLNRAPRFQSCKIARFEFLIYYTIKPIFQNPDCHQEIAFFCKYYSRNHRISLDLSNYLSHRNRGQPCRLPHLLINPTAPESSVSTSSTLAMLLSPGVVVANRAWAVPKSTANCGSTLSMRP